MKSFLLAFVAVVLAALLIFKLTENSAPQSQTASSGQPAFDRVMASRTLRCAYGGYDPFLIVQTDGTIKGIFYDVLEEAAKRLNLKVVWAEEVGYGNINTGFSTGRYDAFCAGLWPAGSRAGNTLFSRAVVWDPITVWVRGNDTRFDSHMEMLNDPAYRLADIDGDATASMVEAFFPKSSRTVMTQSQNIAEEVLQVTTNKADALFADYLSIDRYMQNAPDSLKDLSPGQPPLVYALTIGFNQHEVALRDMFDVVLNDMDRDGTIGHIVKNYLGDKSKLLFRQQNKYEPY